MCTVVILRRPEHRWPLLLAANRDEMADRKWLPPGRHWPDRPNVRAGKDELAGGTWLGMNDQGVVAGVLNRRDSLGPDPNLRSRGELVLEALDHADAVDAVDALGHLDGRSYRSFNMVVADNRDAYWLRSPGPGFDGRVTVTPVETGLSMLTSMEINDVQSPRIRRFLPMFQAAATPDPEGGDWRAWEALLADRSHDANSDTRESMAITTDFGFATLSSSLIALPAMGAEDVKPVWRFCKGTPGDAPFVPVEA